MDFKSVICIYFMLVCCSGNPIEPIKSTEKSVTDVITATTLEAANSGATDTDALAKTTEKRHIMVLKF